MKRTFLAATLLLSLATSIFAMGSLPFAARSSAEVTGGPLRLIGDALVFPSPFDVAADKQLIIQYRLSQNTAVDIFIVSGNGEIIKKMSFEAGASGGSAGINKIKWDGRADGGTMPGNGIYVGTIVDRNSGQLLTKFKVTIYTK